MIERGARRQGSAQGDASVIWRGPCGPLAFPDALEPVGDFRCVGIGLRDRSMMKVEDDITFNDGYETHSYAVVEESDVILVPFLGLKFGYGF